MSKSKFFTASSSDESSSEDDSPQVRRPVVAKNRFAIESSSDSSSSSDSDSDRSDSESSNSSYETSSESSSQASLSAASSASSGDEAAKRQKRMLRWLKDSDDERETKKPVAKPKSVALKPKADTVQAATTVAAPAASAASLTAAEARTRIGEVLRSRGRKGMDRSHMLLRLSEVSAAMAGASLSQWSVSDKLSLEAAEISVRLDKSQLTQEDWRELMSRVQEMVGVAVKEKTAGIQEECDEAEECRRKLSLTIATFAEVLDEELFKTLQAQVNIAEQPEMYVARLRDIPVVVRLLAEVLTFLKGEVNTGLLQAKIALKLLEHVHYQSSASMAALMKSAACVECSSVNDWVRSLALTAATQGGLKEKTTALLLLSFFLATRAQSAGELELVKRLVHCDMAEYLSTAEVATQVAYNRMLASVGLAAFRLGEVDEAHYFLGELCGGNKTRELLAQGGSRGEKTPDQERAERRRMLPYHMHMDAEMIDAAYFVSAMMLEMPLVIGKSGKIVSRSFRKFIEHYERNVAATGPPENFRETLAVAGRALASGEIKRALELVMSMDFWERLGPDAETVQARIATELKISGLKAFLVGNLALQDSYTFAQLASLFELQEPVVKREISAAILAVDIEGAAIDETRKSVVAKTVKTARFAAIAAELQEKLTSPSEPVEVASS